MQKGLQKSHRSALLGLLAAVLFIVFAAPGARAQGGIEVSGFAGWQFWGTVTLREGDLKVSSASNYGGTIAVQMQPEVALEFMYLRQDTDLRLKEFPSGITKDLFDMSAEYYLLGAVYDYPTSERLHAFGSISMGAARFAPKDPKYADNWRFAVAFGGGGKIFLTESIGIRVQGHLLFPIQWGGAGFWCGTGGCSVGAGGSTTFIQGEVSGGLFIAL